MPLANQYISYKISGISFVGSSADLNRNAGAIAGTATASKTMILDASLNYTGVNSFSATYLSGTISTSSQPNITSLGTISDLTTSGNLNISSHNGTSAGLQLGGNLVLATASQLNFNTVTPGAGTASKSLVLDSSRNINNINNLSVTSLYNSGTLAIGSNTNVNNYSLFVQSDGNSFTGLRLKNNNTTNTTSGTEIDFCGYKNDELNNFSLAKIRCVTSAGDTSNVKSGVLVFYTNNGTSTYLNSGYERMRISSTGLIGINTNAPTYQLEVKNTSGQTIKLTDGTNNTVFNVATDGGLNIVPSGSYVNVPSLKINGSLLSSSITELNTLSGATIGSALASKVLIVDSSRNIVNINSLTTSTLAATTISLGGTNLTVNATQINSLNVSPGVASASSALILDSSSNISGINLLTIGSLKIGSTTVTSSAAQLNTVNVTAGTASAGFALVTNGSNNITGINRVGANIIQINGTDVTATAAQLNYNAVTPGTAAPNKALILDGSSNINNIITLTATTLNGTIGTPAQGNITSVGILSGLSTSDAIVTNKTTAGASLLINQNSNTSAIRMVYNSTILTDTYTDASGNLIINPSNKTVMITNGATSVNNQMFFIGNTTTTVDVSNNNALLRFANVSGVNYIQSGLANSAGSSADLFFGDMLKDSSSSTRKLIFKTSGKLGLGISNPTDMMHIVGASGGAGMLTCTNSTVTYRVYIDNSSTTIGNTSNHTFNIITNNVNRLTITQNGYITIGANVNASASPVVSIGSNVKSGIQEQWSPIATPDGGITASSLAVYINNTNVNQNGSWLGTTTDTPFFLFRNKTFATAPLASDAYIALTGNFVNIPIHNGSSTGLQLAGTLVTSTAIELNTLSGTTAGAIIASKAIVVDSSRNITNFNQISATGRYNTTFLNNTATLTQYQTWVNTGLVTAQLSLSNTDMVFGTSTSSPLNLQVNGTTAITIGTDNSTNIIGQLKFNGTNITSTATQLNFLSGITAGAAQASKAMVLDSSRFITNVGKIALSGLNDMLTITNSDSAGRGGLNIYNNSTNWEIGARGSTNSLIPNAFYIYQGGAFRFILDSSGNVTIGSLTPNGKFTVSDTGSGSTTYKLFFKTYDTTSNVSFAVLHNNTETRIGNSYNHSLRIMTNNTDRVIITNTGSVGIGNMSPGYLLDVNGSFNASSYNLSGIVANIGSLTGITPGTALASKALILDSNTSIASISSLSAINLTASTTLFAPNVTLGNQGSAATSAYFISGLDSTVIANGSKTIRFGRDAGQNNAVDLNFLYVAANNVTNAFSIGFPTTGRIMVVLANGNVGIGNTAPTYNLDVTGSINCSSLYSTGNQVNIDSVIGVTPGTAIASKAIITDSNIDITGLRNITLTGTLNCGNLTVSGVTANISVLSGVTPGTAIASKALITDANIDITGLRNITITGIIDTPTLKISGSTVNTAAIIGVTVGTASASKALITDSNNYISGITKLSVGTSGAMQLNILSGGNAAIRFGNSETSNKCWTLQYNNTTNKLSFDPFTSSNAITIDTSGVFTSKASVDTLAYKINGVTANIGALTGITAGIALANKALIVDTSLDIGSIRNITCSGSISSNRSANGVSFSTINGTSTATVFHYNNGAVYFGTTTPNELTFQTNSIQRMFIESSGNTIIPSSYKLLLGGQTTANAVATLDMGTPSSTDRAIAIYNNTSTYYGIGASSLKLKYYSNGHHAWYTGSTAASLGTSIMDLSSGGALTGLTSLTATNLTGLIQTTAQTNITSVGILTGLATSGTITTTYTNNTVSLLDYQTWTNSITIPMTTSLQMSSTAPRFGTSTNHAFRLMTNSNIGMWMDVSQNIAISSNAPSGTYKFEVQGNTQLNGTLTLGSTAITATGTEINTLAGVTAGTASASKAVVLDSSKNIAGINKVSINGAGELINITNSNSANIGYIGYTNNNKTWEMGCRGTTASVYPDTFYMYQGGFRFLIDNTGNFAIGDIAPACKLHVYGSGLGLGFYKTLFRVDDYTNSVAYEVQTSSNDIAIGSKTNHPLKIMTNNTTKMYVSAGGNVGIGSNATTIDKTFGILDGTAGTSTVDFRFGNSLSVNNCMTLEWKPTSSGSGSNYLSFDPYGSSNALTIFSDLRVGMQTNAPTAGLDVAGYINQTITSNYYKIASTSGNTAFVTSGAVSGQGIGIRCRQNLQVDSLIYVASDRRIKKNINPISLDIAKKFLNVEPVTYVKRDKPDDSMLEIGYIAQDCMKHGFGNILTHTNNPDLVYEEEGDVEGIQFSVDYTRVPCILHAIIKDQQEQLEEQNKKINLLISLLNKSDQSLFD